MTPREICEKIVRQGSCYGISCFDDKCPFKDINCDIGKNFIGVVYAKKWLADNPKPILKDGDIRFGPADLKRMSEGLARINEDNDVKKSSYEWQKIYSDMFTIIDPDGWNRQELDRSMNELITEKEFNRRVAISTIQPLKGLFDINEDNTMEKYVEVDSIKEALVLIDDEKLWYKSASGDYFRVMEFRDIINIKKVYKLNPDHCEYKDGVLLIDEKELDVYRHRAYTKETADNFKGYRLPTEAELRTLCPQLYEQFVEDIRKFLEKDTMCDVDLYITDLINKYRSE
jgi:hypothetical protein